MPYSISAEKIAYACSINNTDFTEKRCDEKLKKWISDYDFISIREKSGANKVSTFLNDEKTIYTVLDPTLLNSKDAFDAITNNRIIKGPYIFLYNVWPGMEAVKAAKKISEITGLPVYTAMMDSRIKQILCAEKQGIRVETRHTSPQDFLSLIRYSDLVVTDSFHGTAFALIFEKKFVCINPKDEFGHLKNDERIVNILDITNLKERYSSIENVGSSCRRLQHTIAQSKAVLQQCKNRTFCKGSGEISVAFPCIPTKDLFKGEEMKLELITINDLTNYGNRLQNYATQKFLQKKGFQVENIVDESYYPMAGNGESRLRRIARRVKRSILAAVSYTHLTLPTMITV